ncbi:sigma factor-like helix-turn-helix DNA-binding protein [Streptomyces cacaoi]|uniref:sigma factor-like helix-turn-helix DNA-binding protein n=1 Tax=Streptomyces cacaoi TaxID=1898 RepID=UPI0011F29F96|nr:sigma factor-like helix-turn-helix DNA-binding protein [Streptomyces cacaoi]
MSIIADDRAVEALLEFTASHGDPAGWSAATIELYLDESAAAGLPGASDGLPLTSGQAARLGELATTYQQRLVSAARARLMTRGTPAGQAQDVAEDLVQDVWAHIARRARRAGDILGPQRLDDTAEAKHLFRLTNQAVYRWTSSSADEPVDLDAPAWQAIPAPGPDETGQGPLTDRCEQLLAPLDTRLRAALVEYCYGVPLARIAELLDVERATAARLVQRAVCRLQGRPATAREERQANTQPVRLEDLPVDQREALEAMPETVRVALLLRLAGLSWPLIAERLGRPLATVADWGRRYAYALDPATNGTDQDLPDGWEQWAPSLPARQQMVLALRAEGLSWVRIAEAAACSKSGARSAYLSGLYGLRRAARAARAHRASPVTGKAVAA